MMDKSGVITISVIVLFIMAIFYAIADGYRNGKLKKDIPKILSSQEGGQSVLKPIIWRIGETRVIGMTLVGDAIIKPKIWSSRATWEFLGERGETNTMEDAFDRVNERYADAIKKCMIDNNHEE